jgi:hypothetical protein
MAIPLTMSDLSTTAASNSPAGSEAPTSTDDFHRAIQSILRHTNAKGSDIASATTTNIGAATGEFVDVTGTTTITGLGTIAAGIVRTVRFTGALTLTHNGTSLILPGAANITTAANDIAMFRSLGSGNWICVGYKKQDGTAIVGFNGGTVANATTFNSDVTLSGATLKLVKGADVASSTALPLITDGNYFDVTGTTTVTSFATMGVGTQIVLHFDAALTLTHHSTDLILPGGVSITTAAGDEAGFIEYASGDWRCVYYTRADGRQVNLGTVTSSIRLNTANGFGSTNNKIARFTNAVQNVGTDVTYADSATLGGLFTINKSGVYAISFTSVNGSGSAIGVSLNSSQLTTSVNSITQADVLCLSGSNVSGEYMNASVIVYLASGDLIRAHTDGAAFSGTQQYFSIARVN